jgi:hypothetical protein
MTEQRSPIRVRPLQARDRGRWQELWDRYLSFYRATLPEDVTELTFQRLCAAERGMVGLVAVDAEDRPVGLAHLVVHPATWAASGYRYLEERLRESTVGARLRISVLSLTGRAAGRRTRRRSAQP